jgi:hypothetical protein
MAPPAPAEDAAAAVAAAPPPAPPVAPQPVAPPAWSVPPAPPVAPQPVAPTAWSVASPGAATPASASGPYYQAAPGTPGAPVATIAGIKITPRMLAIGGIVLAVIVGAYLFMNMNSNSGGITFTPSTLSCSTPVTFTQSAHLPSSVKAGDTVTIMMDGKSAGPTTVSASGTDVTQQPDGSWVIVSMTAPSEMQSICAAGGSSGGFNILTPGTHTMQVLDASGKVLAKGSYTVTP